MPLTCFISAKPTDNRAVQGISKHSKNTAKRGKAKGPTLSTIEKGRTLMPETTSSLISTPSSAPVFPNPVNVVTTENGIQVQHLTQAEAAPSTFTFNLLCQVIPPNLEPGFMNPPMPPDTMSASMNAEALQTTIAEDLVFDFEPVDAPVPPKPPDGGVQVVVMKEGTLQ